MALQQPLRELTEMVGLPVAEHRWHLLETWLVEHDIDFIPVGSWTQARDDVQKAVEPDECYVLGSERKARPDLAIEIVWTTRVLDKLPIYAAHEVPEVWIWRRNTLRVFALRDGSYVEASRSELLPDLDLQALISCLDAPTLAAARRAFLG